MKFSELIASVAFDYGLSPHDITGASRSRSHVSARADVAWHLRFFGHSYPEIGRLLGGRDHTTAMNLVRRFGRLI